MRSLWHPPWPVLLAVLLAAEAACVALAPHGVERLPGDAGLYAAAADSLVRDGDLDLLNQCYPRHATLADALPELQGGHGGEFGLGQRGELTLKQSPVLAACAAPFYALFGLAGCVLFNLAVLTLLLVGVAKLTDAVLLPLSASGRGLGGGVARGLIEGNPTPPAPLPEAERGEQAQAPSHVGRWAAVLLLVTTPLRRFAVDLSPDVFLCALLVGGLLAARSRRPALCGVLLGLAAGAKVYVVALALPVALVAVAACPSRWRAVGLGVLGGLLGLAPAAAFNSYQFGRPWVTGYERQLLVVGDTVTVAGHASRFTEPPLAGVANILFDPAVGLLPTAPLLVLVVPAVVVLAARRRLAGWPAGALGAAAANVAVFACYDGWHGGSPAGNRYLFPAVVSAFAVAGAATTEWAGRARRADRADGNGPLTGRPSE